MSLLNEALKQKALKRRMPQGLCVVKHPPLGNHAMLGLNIVQ
jgi:hypothetical protein